MIITGKRQNEAYQEYSQTTHGCAPTGSKTLREFWNGKAQVTSCSWQASNGCVVYFTVTVRKGSHGRQVTYITE